MYPDFECLGGGAGARLRLGRPSFINDTAAELLELGLPGSEAIEVAWKEVVLDTDIFTDISTAIH